MSAIDQLARDIAGGLRESREAVTRAVPRPEILDEAPPEKESVRIPFLAAQRGAAEQYASALLAKDSKLLSPAEAQFLQRETLAAALAWSRGELE